MYMYVFSEAVCNGHVTFFVLNFRFINVYFHTSIVGSNCNVAKRLAWTNFSANILGRVEERCFCFALVC